MPDFLRMQYGYQPCGAALYGRDHDRPTIAAENEYAEDMYQQSELEWLIHTRRRSMPISS